MSDKNLIILDEPTVNLDIESKNKLLNYILNEDKTVIIISHDPEIINMVDNIIYVKEGSIVAEGTYNDLINNRMFKDEVNEA